MPLPSELYDREYFLSEKCEGFDRFRDGAGLSTLKQRELDLLDPGDGTDFLDAGCGRGEVLLAASARGARVAGIDYSEAAVAIASEVLKDVPGTDIRRGDLSALPWRDQSFDLALLGDVIEHLDHDQAQLALSELLRVLRPGGRLLIHTAPNRLFLSVGWPVVRPFLRLTGSSAEADELDAWIRESKRYHVNEQSVFGLRRSLRRAGFREVTAWIDADILRSGGHHLTESLTGRSRLSTLGARVAGLRPLRTILGNDVYALGRRP